MAYESKQFVRSKVQLQIWEHFRKKKITKYFIKSIFVLLKSGKICYSNFQNVFLNIMHIYFRERIIVILKKKERLIQFSNE